ncbi:MAG: hypothetical protein WB780_21225 [Candidatus Acidiferrales bacterium]
MQEEQAVAPMTHERREELAALNVRISETETKINRLKGEVSYFQEFNVRPLKLALNSTTSAHTRNNIEISLRDCEPQLLAKQKELSDLESQLRGLCAQRAEIAA